MGRVDLKRILVFITISYDTGIFIDLVVFLAGINPLTHVMGDLWAFSRMWSVTLSSFVCVLLHRESIGTMLRSFLVLSRKTAVYYFLWSPLIVYITIGIYIVIASPLGLFDLGAITEVLVREVNDLPGIRIEQALLLYVFPIGYLLAITLHALYALGEEIGWRGYLYNVLGAKPTLTNTIIVGSVWSLWHAPAILLFGLNYGINRLVGILIFIPFCVAHTYSYLYTTTKSKSVLPAASLHGTLNSLWVLMTWKTSRIPMEQRELLLGLGILGTIAWSVTSISLYAIYRFIYVTKDRY
ncbi:MAG: CPBP family intramembrane glutamic endopeptidase [Candidatus Korarchaeum sp.]